MKARSRMSLRIGVSSFGLLSVLALFAPRAAQAQAADAAAAKGDADEEEEEEAPSSDAGKAEAKPEAEAKAEVKVDANAASASASATEGETVVQPDSQSERPNGWKPPPMESTLEWHGGLETDGTYASYTIKDDLDRPQAFYDVRGRFVVGPTLEHRFGADKTWFVAARGELVGWVRERGAYQVNADDVYGQVGKKGLWDVKFGRFESWRVYHKGAGFDRYTIEDNGACATTSVSCSQESGTFGPHTYEVNYNYYRDPFGRAALHLYPTPWSGIEVFGLMGNADGPNTLGGRAAALVHFPYVRASAAVEYRATRPARKPEDSCPKCSNVSDSIGYGGGVELTIKPVAAGVNVAQGKYETYNVTSGAFDSDASHTRTSMGGYAEVDVGSLTLERSLVVGFGLNRTEVLDKVNNFEQHYQGSAYALFPLGFQDASVKLVVSQATLDSQSDEGNGIALAVPTKTMRAARVRFTYPF
jgi:hypothetical protein